MLDFSTSKAPVSSIWKVFDKTLVKNCWLSKLQTNVAFPILKKVTCVSNLLHVLNSLKSDIWSPWVINYVYGISGQNHMHMWVKCPPSSVTFKMIMVTTVIFLPPEYRLFTLSTFKQHCQWFATDEVFGRWTVVNLARWDGQLSR